MRTKQKMALLAAVPLAALLAGGGVAVAQASSAPPAARVVQQAVVHHAPDAGHRVTSTTQEQPARCDADHGKCDGGRQAQGQTAKTGAVTVAQNHHCDSCDDQCDR